MIWRSARRSACWVSRCHRAFHGGSTTASRECKVFDTFTSDHAAVNYEQAWRWQRYLMEKQGGLRKIGQEGCDALILLQHPSTYTLGRGSTLDNLKFPLDSTCPHNVARIERGGEVTWHGPGQLVAYPIFDLTCHKKDLHWWVRSLEEVVIQTLALFDIKGQRDDINTGVWVGKSKICAIGVSASRWVTMHGLALNINNSTSGFAQIVPCGIAESDRGVCTMAQFAPDVSHRQVKEALLRNMREVFGVAYVQGDVHELENEIAGAAQEQAAGLVWLSAPR